MEDAEFIQFIDLPNAVVFKCYKKQSMILFVLLSCKVNHLKHFRAPACKIAKKGGQFTVIVYLVAQDIISLLPCLNTHKFCNLKHWIRY